MTSRTQRGWELTKKSLQILGRNKRVLLFPVTSGLCCLILLWLVGKPLWHIESNFLRSQQEVPLATTLGILTLIVMLLMFNVINMYCSAALIACIANYFKTERLNLIVGFKAGWACLPNIVGWTLFNTTIGFALRKFPSRLEQAGTFASLLSGTAWGVVSYFIVPILVLENISPIKAIKKSSDVVHETWGKSLISNTSSSLILSCIILICLLPLSITVFIGNKTHLFVGLVISILFLIILTLIITAANNILRTAFYLYATDRDTALPYNSQVISTAFCSRK